MIINMMVRGQRLTAASNAPLIVSDTINYIDANFAFLTPDWDGLVKWAHFAQGDKVYDVMLEDDKITQDVGLDLDAGLWQVYLHGNRIEDGIVTQRITTDTVGITVRRSGVLNGEPLPGIPPSAAEQILADAEAAKRIAQSVRDDADKGAFDGAQGPVGPKGDKGDKGDTGDTGATGPQGPSGLDAPQIDDETASADHPWSGDKTAKEIDAAELAVINKVCPPFEASGSVVQCYPVEGYPLQVVSEIEAYQEGEGDPGPDHVRPIKGWDSLELTRCGKNLLDRRELEKYDNWRVDIATSGTYPTTIDRGYLMSLAPGTQYTVSFDDHESYPKYFYLCHAVDGVGYLDTYLTAENVINNPYSFTAQTGVEYFLRLGWTQSQATFAIMISKLKDLQLEIGSSATSYAPYTGDTYAQALPETVYGGQYNWTTGELLINRERLVLSSETIRGKSYYAASTAQTTPVLVVYDFHNLPFNDKTWRCNQFRMAYETPIEADNMIFSWNSYFGIGCFAIRHDEWDSLDSALQWLDERYAGNNPVVVEYPLAEPYTLHLSPRQIQAVSGVNTLFGSAGNTTVSGRLDPIHITQSMLDRLAALSEGIGLDNQ